jgi:type VI secretion system protein ImpG
MQTNDTFYNNFLEELNLLEKFRMAYSGMHSSDILGRDDPDVKRMIEAMAFFSTRTRLSALHNIEATQRRLFDQYFSFLLTPLPAMGILQAEISGRFVEPALLPKDSEIRVATREHSAVFRTIHDLKILPISLKKVETVFQLHQGYRILLHFKASYPRNDSIDLLSLYTNYLNDYNASLRFLHTLKQHLVNSLVFFEEDVKSNSKGTPCPLFFGSPVPPDSTTNGDLSHPLQKLRTFFHFPQTELYLNFQIPRPPRNWSHFVICLEMNERWPKELTVNKEIFQLFTVPVLNLKQEMAQPILCDGTQERYPIHYQDPKPKFSLHSVLGVYEITREGLQPLKSGVISGGSGSYEIEKSQETGHTYLILKLPEAFAKPKKIAIDALWLQPWFSERLSEELHASLLSRNIEGVSWEFLGEVRPHEENPLQKDGEGILKFLSLQKKPVFNQEEILFLLKSLGSLSHGRYQMLPQSIQDMEVSTVPQSRKVGGLKNIYRLRLKEFDQSQRPLVEIFLKRLVTLLQACSFNVTVAIEAKMSSTGEVLQLEE